MTPDAELLVALLRTKGYSLTRNNLRWMFGPVPWDQKRARNALSSAMAWGAIKTRKRPGCAGAGRRIYWAPP